MHDPFNKIFTLVKGKIKDKCPNAGTSVDGSPPSFPYAGFRQLDNAAVADDMENNENAVSSAIEITVFSNKNVTEAKNIMSTICDTMREMGFQRKGPFTPSNASDTNIYRIIYRFDRIIGIGDIF